MAKFFSRTANKVLDYIIMAFGAALYAVALEAFLLPNLVSPGGVAGLASIVNYLLDLPTGFVTLLLNLPLFVWAGVKLGWRFLRKTAFATILMSVFIDVAAKIVPAYTGDRLLAALYGGIIGGASLALVFMRGGSTGGFDIIAKLVSLRFPLFSIGRLLLLLDGVVVAAAMLAYNDVETALYTIVTLFVSSRVIDGFIYGAQRGQVALIVTDKPDEMKAQLFEIVGRGATLLDAKGGWRGTDCSVVMCAVRGSEVAKLHRAVRAADKHAFVMLADASEIAGEGFRPTNE